MKLNWYWKITQCKQQKVQWCKALQLNRLVCNHPSSLAEQSHQKLTPWAEHHPLPRRNGSTIHWQDLQHPSKRSRLIACRQSKWNERHSSHSDLSSDQVAIKANILEPGQFLAYRLVFARIVRTSATLTQHLAATKQQRLQKTLILSSSRNAILSNHSYPNRTKISCSQRDKHQMGSRKWCL